MILTRVFLAFWCAICASVASAHEFWIEPAAYHVAPGDHVTAQLKNGQAFKGISLAYFERRFTRFDVIIADKVVPVDGRMGDSPALDVVAPKSGLMIVVHETTPSLVTYRDWEKFLVFAQHKDFPDIAARHAANGFGPVPFKERYTRHAKALIGVGDGAGTDRAMGLKTEFVALNNPYDPDFGDIMRVRLLYQGKPRVDAQVEVFDRDPEGGVAISLHRTDTDGVAAVPVAPGHDYLLDGVVLRRADDGDKAVWDTFWAALTFGVPAP